MTVKVFLALAGLAAAVPARALQPPEEFLRAARTGNVDSAEARAARRQARAQASSTLGVALPRLSLRGTYTQNEHATRLATPDGGSVTLTPRDHLDGSAVLDVPLVDLSSFARIAAARTQASAAAHAEASTALDVEGLVSQEYYQLVANLALVEAAQRALDVARASLRIAEQRHEAGAVALLDVERARAEVERQVQQLAAADLQVALGARALQSMTGLSPELEGEVVALADDLRPEPPLESFTPPDGELPAVAAAVQGRVASEQLARARKLALVPSLGASIAERATSAEGLAGRTATWQAVVALTWSLDLTTLADVRVQEAAADGARAREQRARLAAHDAIHGAWEAVRTNVARSRSARVQAQVSAHAAELALTRYEVGEATQLDLLQAQRDAFAAEVSRIQADADLVNSRAQLRVAAGQSLLSRNLEVPASPREES
jgi:outer membrane protein TolC